MIESATEFLRVSAENPAVGFVLVPVKGAKDIRQIKICQPQQDAAFGFGPAIARLATPCSGVDEFSVLAATLTPGDDGAVGVFFLGRVEVSTEDSRMYRIHLYQALVNSLKGLDLDPAVARPWRDIRRVNLDWSERAVNKAR